MAAVEVLEASPRMGAAFARALVPARSGAGQARVPERAVEVRDQEQDRERLAAYARVCGFTLRDAVPPTWIHVLTFPLHVHLLGSSESTVRLVGAVHATNSMTLHRPVDAWEPLTLRVQAAHLRPHARGGLVDLVGTAHVGQELVWEGVSTYLSPGARVDGEPEPTAHRPFEPATPGALWRLPADLGRRYRAVSKDPNLIHTSRLAARAFGFTRPIIHGMWTHARALASLEGRLPQAYTADVAFLRPLLLPSTAGVVTRHVDGAHHVAVTNRDGSKPHVLMTLGAP